MTIGMGLSPIEKALADAVLDITGLPSKQVYFTTQGQRPPSNVNRIAITVGEIPLLGQSETTRRYDPRAPLNQEITQTRTSMATMTVSFAGYGPDVVGESGPRDLVSEIRAGLDLPKYRAQLRLVGLGLNNRGSLHWAPKIQGAEFEGCATFDALFSCAETASQKNGYIARVKAEVFVDDVDVGTIDAQIADLPHGVVAGVVPGPTVSIAVAVDPQPRIAAVLPAPISAISVTV